MEKQMEQSKIKVTFEKSVFPDPMTRNYDHKIYKVSDGVNTAKIYYHNRAYYNLRERTPYKTPEECFMAVYSNEAA